MTIDISKPLRRKNDEYFKGATYEYVRTLPNSDYPHLLIRTDIDGRNTAIVVEEEKFQRVFENIPEETSKWMNIYTKYQGGI